MFVNFFFKHVFFDMRTGTIYTAGYYYDTSERLAETVPVYRVLRKIGKTRKADGGRFLLLVHFNGA